MCATQIRDTMTYDTLAAIRDYCKSHIFALHVFHQFLRQLSSDSHEI